MVSEYGSVTGAILPPETPSVISVSAGLTSRGGDQLYAYHTGPRHLLQHRLPKGVDQFFGLGQRERRIQQGIRRGMLEYFRLVTALQADHGGIGSLAGSDGIIALHQRIVPDAHLKGPQCVRRILRTEHLPHLQRRRGADHHHGEQQHKRGNHHPQKCRMQTLLFHEYFTSLIRRTNCGT